MGDIKGFLKVQRKTAAYRPVCERIKDFREVELGLSEEDAYQESCRCLRCDMKA